MSLGIVSVRDRRPTRRVTLPGKSGVFRRQGTRFRLGLQTEASAVRSCTDITEGDPIKEAERGLWAVQVYAQKLN
jgi:hypothetical protein